MVKILVVDDQQVARFLVRQIFEKVSYKVLEAENGKKALEILETEPNINLIITDIQMPVLDGMTFLETICQNKKYMEIPKFILTANTNKELKERGKALGALYWLVKPCPPNNLLQAVKEVLELKGGKEKE